MEKKDLLEFCHQVDIGGYHINYVRVGCGPVPIFCFPGLLGKDFILPNRNHWNYVIEFLNSSFSISILRYNIPEQAAVDSPLLN